ncbi:MAG: 1-acyl-sn-glycerol-3-phosphate acyltransferase [Rhodospirillales bacterium CG15_BIG_FIL_POST_REV_8_21_14_020_66_15]|nr:MAG: 1-acyl-sn-glycerol-3-phosphate acyltransferase [Rhodospirillales bacterium CG15_BIG_FIL_POST_REV_8_21_14_020_66_15]
MILLRSILFGALFFPWTALCSLMVAVALVFPRKVTQTNVKVWGIGVRFLLKWVVGLGWRVEGLENVPPGPCVIAAKHQSAWDTMVFHALLPDPVYVVKKELTRIPFWGWGFYKAGCVVVDRKAGAKALKHLVQGVQVALARGSQVVIFPEGTRTAPDQRLDYHPGIAAVYRDANVPVVPVALDSGLFWGRRAALKYPGEITIKFMEPILPGLDRREFLALLQDRVEGESARLMAEKRARFPHLPRPRPLVDNG